MAKKNHQNGMQVLPGVELVIKKLEKLPFVSRCRPSLYHNLGNGNPDGLAKYYDDTPGGLRVKVYVTKGFQFVDVILEHELLGLWDGKPENDPRRIVIDHLIYHHQLPYERKDYQPPNLMPNNGQPHIAFFAGKWETIRQLYKLV